MDSNASARPFRRRSVLLSSAIWRVSLLIDSTILWRNEIVLIYVYPRSFVVKNFRYMDNSLHFLLSIQSTCNVHQTARVGHDQGWRLGHFKIAYLSFQPFPGKFRVFHRHDPTEAAAFLGVRQLHESRAFDIC